MYVSLQVQDDVKVGRGDTVSMVVTMNSGKHNSFLQHVHFLSGALRRFLVLAPQVQDDVKLGRGDTVSMVVTFNARSGERNGTRVKRVSF